MAQAAGYAVLPITPSLLGINEELRSQLVAPTQKASKQAGSAIRKEMAAGVDQAAKDVEKANFRVKKSAEELATAESKLAEQKLKSEAANKAVEAAARAREEAESKGVAAVEKAEESLLKKRAAAEREARNLAKAQQGVENALTETARAAESLEKRQEALTKATDEGEKSSKSLRDRFREMGDEANSTGGLFDGLAGKVGGLAGAFAGVAGVAGFAGLGKALASETQLINLQLGYTGAAAEGVGDSIKEALSSGVAGSAEEAANAIGSLESQFKWLGSEGEQTAGELADNFMAFSKVFEVDMAEATQTAGQLIENGLASDVENAADLMTAAMQQVPAQMRDELPEIINEYGTNFRALGFTGEEAFGLLVSAAEKGKFALDKTGDALKEFTIRGADMSTTSVEAYEAIGLNAEEMSRMVATGGEQAQEALMKTAGALQDIEDPAERANTAIALFGTPLEDLSVDQIPDFLDSLTGMGDGMANVEGASQAMADTIANSLDGRLDRLKGTVQGLAGDAFMWAWDTLENDLIPAFKDMGEWVQRNEEWLGPLAAAVGAAAGAWALWTGAIKAWQLTTKIATGIQVAFNAVMAANPIMLAAMAIAGLTAGLVYFFTQTETGKAAWETFTNALSAGWEWVKTTVFDAWTATTEAFSAGWEATTGAVSAAWTWLKDGLAAGWELIKTLIFDAFTFYIDTWKLIFETAINLVSGAWTWLKDGLVAGWDIIRTAVFDAFNFYVDLVKNTFQTVVDGIGAGWNWLKDTLSNGWNWIKDKVFSAFTNTIESVKDRFSGFVDALGNKWSSLRALLAKPVNFLISTVYNDGILRAFNVIAGILPGLEPGSPLAGIPEHATGGRIKGPGTGTSDDVLMWGSNGEHMWTAAETQKVGGHGAMYAMRDAVDTGRPFTYDGQGGLAILPKTDERAGDLAGAAPGLLIPGYKDGGEIRPMWEIQLENGHRAAKMRNGNPYTWGFEDCSGYMSAIADAIINGGDGKWSWATGSFPGGQPWVPGLGQGFSVGVHDNPGGPGGGHTAGTLTGVGPYATVNVESGGGHGYVAYGGPAAGADSPQFQGVHPGQFHLAIGADGAFESGGGGGFDPGAMRSWISEKLGGVVDTIMDPIVSMLPEKPPEWQGIPRGVYDTGRDGLVESIADGVAGLSDGLATVWNAVRNIPDLVADALNGADDVNDAAGEGYHKGGLAGRGRGLMQKTAIEPEMVLNPAMTQAFIRWMDASPESLNVMGKEISEAFFGGDWGYGELASTLGSPEVAQAIVQGAAALGEISREIGPVAGDASRGFFEAQATSLLDVVGLGGLVPFASDMADKHGPALAQSAQDMFGGISVSGSLGPNGATVIIEAESDEDLVRVGQLKALADQVYGLDVQVNARKRPPAAAVTRGGVM